MDHSNTETDTEKQPGHKDLGLGLRNNPSSSHGYTKSQTLQTAAEWTCGKERN